MVKPAMPVLSSQDAGALARQAEQLMQAGKYADAADLALHALSLQEKASPADRSAEVEILDTLATLYRIQRRYADAEQALTKSLAIGEISWGRDHPQLCRALTHLAVLFSSQERYADAEPHLNRCLNARVSALGPDHIDIGQSLHELARLYRAQGRHAQAEPIYARAVRLLGPNHPEAVLAAIRAGKFETAARALDLQVAASPGEAARAVRHTFFGQATDLRWTAYRPALGAASIMIEGEATHGNGLWQPFAVLMVRDGTEFKLRRISVRGLAWR